MSRDGCCSLAGGRFAVYRKDVLEAGVFGPGKFVMQGEGLADKADLLSQ